VPAFNTDISEHLNCDLNTDVILPPRKRKRESENQRRE